MSKRRQVAAVVLGEKCSGQILVKISVVGGNNSRDKLLGDKMCIM